MDEITLSSHQKIGLVKYQLEDLKSGKLKSLTCPYCGTVNEQPQNEETPPPLCCSTLAMCLDAIFADESVAEAMQKARKIADNVVATQILSKKIRIN